MCINYSIIIPHKNVPVLLSRCLKSIPRRKDVQIIVVDDNSDSSIVDFNKFPGMGEPSVEVYFTKEGKGAGYARNIGMRHAKGKWLLFADADDYYEEGFLSVLDVQVNSQYDIVFYDASGEDKSPIDRCKYYNDIYQRYFKGICSIDELKYLIWVTWNKMFRSILIFSNKLEFDEIPVGNDAFFSLKASKLAKDVLVLPEKLYIATYNPNIITFKKRNFTRELEFLNIDIRINRFLRNHHLSSRQNHLISMKKLYNLIKLYGIRCMIMYLTEIHRRDSLLHYIFFTH